MQSKFLLSHKICEELQSTTANKMLAYTILILRSLELSTKFALFHTNAILACVQLSNNLTCAHANGCSICILNVWTEWNTNRWTHDVQADHEIARLKSYIHWKMNLLITPMNWQLTSVMTQVKPVCNHT